MDFFLCIFLNFSFRSENSTRFSILYTHFDLFQERKCHSKKILFAFFQHNNTKSAIQRLNVLSNDLVLGYHSLSKKALLIRNFKTYFFQNIFLIFPFLTYSHTSSHTSIRSPSVFFHFQVPLSAERPPCGYQVEIKPETAV